MESLPSPSLSEKKANSFCCLRNVSKENKVKKSHLRCPFL